MADLAAKELHQDPIYNLDGIILTLETLKKETTTIFDRPPPKPEVPVADETMKDEAKPAEGEAKPDEAEAAGRDDGRSAKRAETTEDGRGPAGTAAPATLGRRLGRCCCSRSPSSAAAAWPLLLGWQCAAGPVGTDHCCNLDTAQPAESARLLPLQAAAALALSAS